VEVEEQDIVKIQLGRALFKETVCRRFCQILGVEPAGVGFRDIEEASLTPGIRTLGGFHMEEMYFVSRDHDSANEKISLHDLQVARSEPEIPGQDGYAALPPNFRAMVLFFRMVSWIVRPLLMLLALFFRLYVLIGRIPFLRRFFARHGPIHDSPIPIHDSPFLANLCALQTRGSRQEGRTLINDRHRCRITLPEGADPHITGPFWLFAFRIDDLEIMVDAVRPSQLRDRLGLRKGLALLEDTKFFVGALPARLLVFEIQQPGQGVNHHYSYYVQAPRAIYQFSFGSFEPVSAETLASIRSIVDSFELT
jgi:hypothetical protein